MTGIPLHILLLSELHIISRQVISLNNDFREVHKTELDVRELGGETFHAQQIIDELDQARLQIARMIEDQQGYIQVTSLPTRGIIGCQAQIISPNGPGWHMHGVSFHMLPKDWKFHQWHSSSL